METARELKGAARRRFMAKTVQESGFLRTISSLHRTLMESTYHSQGNQENKKWHHLCR